MMKNSPKVSILIPTYNRENIIVETLTSAINQTYKNIEIVVNDNKSTDNSYEQIKSLAKSNSRIKAYQNKTNLGPVKNWHMCMRRATGKYAKILWSDDLIRSDFIEKTLPWLENQNDTAFVCTGIHHFHNVISKKTKIVNCCKEEGKYSTDEFIEKVLLGKKISVSASHALFRMKDIKKNTVINIPNKFGSDFSMHGIGPDALMFLLTAKDYRFFAFVNESLTFYRDHDTSISISTPSSKLLMLHMLARAFFVEKYVIDPKLKKKFNARILYILLYGHGLKSKIGIRSIDDFYLNDQRISIDYIFLVKLICKKYLKHLAKKTLSNYPSKKHDTKTKISRKVNRS